MFGLSPPTPGVRKGVIFLSIWFGLVTVALPVIFGSSQEIFIQLAFWPGLIWLILDGVLLLLYGRAVLPALWIAPLVLAWPCFIVLFFYLMSTCRHPCL
jgi:hypothetical protein